MASLQREQYINDILNRLSELASNMQLRSKMNLLDFMSYQKTSMQGF